MASETAVCQLKLRSAVKKDTVVPLTTVVTFVVRSVGLHFTSGMLTNADHVRNMMYAVMMEDYNLKRKNIRISRNSKNSDCKLEY